MAHIEKDKRYPLSMFKELDQLKSAWDQPIINLQLAKNSVEQYPPLFPLILAFSGFVPAFPRNLHWSPFSFNLFSLACGNFHLSELFLHLCQWLPICSLLSPLIPTYSHRFLLLSYLFPPIPRYSDFVSACSIGSLQFRIFPLIPRVPSFIVCSRF